MNLGKINTLKVERRTDNGIYLVDEDSNEVLLPNKYVRLNTKMDTELDVFVYKDTEDRIIATTLTPHIQLNNYAALEAVSISRNGAFFDWGLEGKDLLVPYKQQAERIEVGYKYVVYMYHDEVSDRLVGTTKLNHTFEREKIGVSSGDQVRLLPYQKTNMGYRVVVNNKYQGMLFKDQIFGKVNIGDSLSGFVKNVRDDGKLDITLNRFGYKGIDANVEKLLNAIKKNKGKLNLNDKSNPQDIYNQLGISKKVFKKAVGALYKKKDD